MSDGQNPPEQTGGLLAAPLDPRPVLQRFSLADKVIVLTGASSGLGVADARAIAEAGGSLVLAARRAERLEETAAMVRALGAQVEVVQADVTDPADCRRVVEAAVTRFGRVDGLVNNAGVDDPFPAKKLTLEDFHRVLSVNVTSCLTMAQACQPAMPRGSSIVNVSSVLGRSTIAFPMGTAYLTSKAGVLGLTRSLAVQWTHYYGIRTNAVLPGFFPSEMTGPGQMELLADRFVMRRLGEPSELAAAVVFLLSDASSYMTGSELVVDGGFLLT